MASQADKPANLGSLSHENFQLLSPLSTEDRRKVLRAVRSLFDDPDAENPEGESKPRPGSPRSHAAGTGGAQDAQQYFAAKAPQNKGEMLAVAAKFREEHSISTSHTSADFAAFFKEARQNFDSNHFTRDMKNAQNQAHLFNKGTPRGQYQLSYYGQQYIDALPDRDAVKKLPRPNRRGPQPKKAKKARK